jgi:hypothetical protein
MLYQSCDGMTLHTIPIIGWMLHDSLQQREWEMVPSLLLSNNSRR